jgi:GTP-binding protein EngB required for normal cell division
LIAKEMLIDEKKAMIEADRMLLSSAQNGKISHLMVATEIKKKDQKYFNLVSIEKAAQSETPSKIRFAIKAIQPNNIEDLL